MSSEQKGDIQNYDEILDLIRRFYSKLLQDPVTGVKFNNVKIEDHVPRIADFWAFILIDKPGYKGSVYEKHLPLNLKSEHYEKWLYYWEDSVREIFSGPKAELAVHRAQLLAYTFQHKDKIKDQKKIL